MNRTEANAQAAQGDDRETRAKLIAAGRKAFGEDGYADASMDDFTAEAGLTRGALYHHFGGKRAAAGGHRSRSTREMYGPARRAFRPGADASGAALSTRIVGYIEMALEPEIQRIVLRDGPAVLGDPSTWPAALGCVRSIMPRACRRLQDGGASLPPMPKPLPG